MRRVYLFLWVFFLAVSVFGKGASENPFVLNQPADHRVNNSVDSGGEYLKGWSDLTPIIMTYVNNDGSISVCSPTDTVTYIFEYSKEMEYIRTVDFSNEFPNFGAFTKDNEGSYYLFYAKDVDENEKNTENMALVKYDNVGTKVNTYKLKAYADNSFNGVKSPFQSGACRMEISGNMLCVYFARQKFMSADGLNHQSSYGFIVNKDTFRRVDIGQVANNGFTLSGMSVPYTSHSYNQFLLPVDDGFAFVDQGDAYPRGFVFSRFRTSEKTKRITAVNFKQGRTYQYTFAQLGGLAKTSHGYIFTGTYEKNSVVSAAHNDSRNLFVFNLDDEMSVIGDPVWITDYNDKDKFNAANPKITEIDKGRFLLMWECMAKTSYETTYMTIINENGKMLTPVKNIGSLRLNYNDTLRYNKTTGDVFWAINSDERTINIFAFNPDSPVNIRKESKSTAVAAKKPSRPSYSQDQGDAEPDDDDAPAPAAAKAKPKPKAAPKEREKREFPLAFQGALGFYANGWHQNLFSIGFPIQLGAEFTFANMAIAVLAEGGVGIGSESIINNVLLEWNYGGTAEFYLPFKKLGVCFGYGYADSWLISDYGHDVTGDATVKTITDFLGIPLKYEEPDLFRLTYMRFGIILRGKSSKTIIYGSLYADDKWGFGIQLNSFL